MRTYLIPFVLGLISVVPALGETILVEAEQFEDLGGWVSDCQFMDQMGSPFVLAHGLGIPVRDARSEIALPAAGMYRVWVRTRDWVATWNAPGAPGRFQLLIDGQPLKTVFGTEGAKWHWQDGGTVRLDRTVDLALHDLTGFEGRCDAILLTSDLDFRPPNKDPEMTIFRRKLLGLPDDLPTVGPFDLVVVGGGISGTCATLCAARLGLKVALVQDRPVLGGNNSSEVRVWLQGARNKQPYPRVGDVVRELEQARHAHYGPENTADLYEDQRKIALVRAEENVSLFLNHRANGVEMDGKRIGAVIAEHTIHGGRKRLVGRWFVDSTGDGCLGFLAGADHEITPTGHLGRCNLWNVIDTGQPVAMPPCPWALDLSDKPFPGRAKKFPGLRLDRRGTEALGGWYWESGFDHDPMEKSEYIRDWNFRAMYGAWDALKNVDGRYPNHKLMWAAYVCGKRESRRLLGDVVLTKEDVLSNKEYADGCVPTGWPFDLHLPDPRYEKGFEGDAFIAEAHYTHYKPPYWVPYRCLYSRSVPNLLMAGRDISVTHEALGTVRVMRTGGCMGEIVGMAASICKQHDTSPRGVYRDHLDELIELMTRGVGKPMPPHAALRPPEWLDSVGENLAPKATVTVSASRNEKDEPPSLISDGRADLLDNGSRWLSTAKVPCWVEFHWPTPQTIAAARVISGYNYNGAQVNSALHGFVLQYHDGQQFRDVPGTSVKDNGAVDWNARFEPVTTVRLRLLVTATDLDIARIWEVALYGLKR